MSRATSYTLNDRMELAGPTLEEQAVEAVARMERHGVKVERLPKPDVPTIKRGLTVPNL